MATRLSESFRRMALNMVDRFGAEYILRRPVQGTPDPQHPTKPVVEAYEDYPCKAAITAYKVEQIDFIQVHRGDMQAVVAYTSDIPDNIVPGDLFVDGDLIYNIIPPEERITINGALVCYILQLRR